MKMTQFSIGKIGLIDRNILLVDIESGREIGVNHIYELKNIAYEIVQKAKLYSIVNYGAYSLPTKEARELCGKNEYSNHILARAIVVHDMGQLIIVKHTIKNKISNVPTKIFMDIEKAKEWLDKLRFKNIENQQVG